MSTSPTSPTAELVDTQHGHMAQFYSLLESFIGFPLNSPAAPSNTPGSSSYLPKVPENEFKKGVFECRLCGTVYLTPVHLAQHSCPQMIRTAFHCHQCQKAFSCSANLASHQRWHTPKSASSRGIPRHPDPLPQFVETNLLNQGGGRTAKSSSATVLTALFPPARQKALDNLKRTTSFTIDSILQSDPRCHQPQAPFVCFRCHDKFATQSDLEDHIIDHLLCNHGP